MTTDAARQPTQELRAPDAGYRPDIDGLRAVAVLSVLFYHFDLGLFEVPGGYTGVDVFFVISGYLITQILVAEAGQAGALKRFYLRRFRRIFPALLAVIGVCLIAGYFLLMPGDYADLGESARYALFALGNLYFYLNTGYFDQVAELQMLLHTWSLAVEEQFYLVWPLVVLLTLRNGRHTPFLIACVVIVVASFIYSVLLVDWEPKNAFYNPLARAWELALGGLLVFVPALRGRPVLAEAANVIGIGLIGYGFFALTSDSSFPGANALFACVGSALLIWPKGDSYVVAPLLSTPAFRGVGLISYSLYLWHWPVLVFARHYYGDAIPEVVGIAMVALVFVLSWLSWRYVEQPFRRRSFLPDVRPALAVVSVMLLTVAATGVFVTDGAKFRIPSHALPLSDLRVMWEWQPRERQSSPVPEQMVFGAPWESADRRLVLWGDSHAQHMAPLLEAAIVGGAEDEVSVLVNRPCPANVDGREAYVHDRDAEFNHDCQIQRSAMFEFLAGADVDAVLLASSWTGLVRTLVAADDEAAGLRKLETTLGRTVDELLRVVPNVVLLGQVPKWTFNPVPCVYANAAGYPHHGCGGGTSELSVEGLATLFQIDRLMGDLGAADPRVSALLPSRNLCDPRTCVSVIDGHFLYRDTSHLRRNLPEPVRHEIATRIGLAEVLAFPDSNPDPDPVLAGKASR